MKVERLVAYTLLLLTALLIVAAFYNPISTYEFSSTDTYFKDAHREALLFYAAFTFIPSFMMLLWSDTNNPFISKTSWLLLAVAVIMTAAILYLTYLVDPYDTGFNDYVTYSWYVVYALTALIILTIVYLVAKLFKVGKE